MNLKRICFVAGFAVSACLARADERPNIVVLFTDDQSYLAIGSSGNREIKTPQMDRLGRDGVIFENHYNSTAICMGSRASLMTGKFEYKTGCNFLHGPMRPETFQTAYPVLLREAGYWTGFAGKFGFAVATDEDWKDVPEDRQPSSDFDVWAGGRGQTRYETAKNKPIAKYADKYPHSTRAYGAWAQDFIKEAAGKKEPFCMTLFFKAPHGPATADPYFDPIYEGVTFSKPDNYGRAAATHLAPQARLGRQYLRYFHQMGFDEKGYQKALRIYYQQIYGVDYAIGMIREELERQRVADNTIIILTSDNGYFCGAHGLGGKVLPYEEGSKAPLIVYDPRLEKQASGNRREGLTGTIDVAPTVLSYAGVQAPMDMDGQDLRPLLTGEKRKLRDSLPLFQAWGAPTSFGMSVVTEDKKYVFWAYGDKMDPAEELFDLAKDPGEMTNVASNPEFQPLLEEMRARYGQQLKSWKRSAVSYNHYSEFATLLDRSIPWDEKKGLVPEHQWEHYTYLHEHVGLEEGDMYDYEKVLDHAK